MRIGVLIFVLKVNVRLITIYFSRRDDMREPFWLVACSDLHVDLDRGEFLVAFIAVSRFPVSSTDIARERSYFAAMLIWLAINLEPACLHAFILVYTYIILNAN